MARPRTFDEHEVLEAARQAFWTNGYTATSLDDLTAATGLGKGSLYAAFGGKRELFERVFGDYCAAASAQTHELLDGPDAGAYVRLRAYVLANAKECGPSGDGRGCLIAKTAAELAGADDGIASSTRTIYETIVKALTACIEGAQRCGDIAASANAGKLATLLFAALRGIEALGKAGMPAATLRRAADAALEALPAPP
jgi:TetR/AcrR family transcriptional regulator, transcriptional repressor for nem operon